jgi:hypothetical protein
MPIRRLLFVLALIVAACASPTPNESQEPSGVESVALACWSVEPGECDRALTEAAGLLPDDHPPVVAASVVAFGCDAEPCDVGLRRGGSVSIEFENGGGLHGWLVSVLADGSLVFGDHNTGMPEPYLPQSPRMTAPVVDFSLGHCGLSSPIDIDGSFWNPVGPVDSDAPDAINSSDGRFSLVGPNDAQFRSRTGFAFSLRRHQGEKNFSGCD